MTARRIRICDLVLIVSLTRNLAKTKFLFSKRPDDAFLLYIDVDETSKFNEIAVSSFYSF